MTAQPFDACRRCGRRALPTGYCLACERYFRVLEYYDQGAMGGAVPAIKPSPWLRMATRTRAWALNLAARMGRIARILRGN